MGGRKDGDGRTCKCGSKKVVVKYSKTESKNERKNIVKRKNSDKINVSDKGDNSKGASKSKIEENFASKTQEKNKTDFEKNLEEFDAYIFSKASKFGSVRKKNPMLTNKQEVLKAETNQMKKTIEKNTQNIKRKGEERCEDHCRRNDQREKLSKTSGKSVVNLKQEIQSQNVVQKPGNILR